MSTSLQDQIFRSRILLKNPYAYLDAEGGFDAISRNAGEANSPFQIDLDALRSPKLIGKRLSFEQIEDIAKKLQREIWVNRRRIWADDVPEDPLEVLQPGIAFDLIGYRFECANSLGQFLSNEGMIEVAGFIDRSKM